VLLRAGAAGALLQAQINEQEADLDAPPLLQLLYRLRTLKRKWTPFSHDLRFIEAHSGASVAAYFNFARWMIFNCR
jgi:hypothetical protein